MNSAATDLLALFELSGLAAVLSRPIDVPIDARHVLETRSGSGAITFDISEHECFIVTRITVDNVDWSVAATMAVTFRSATQPPLTTALEALNDVPVLLVFDSGRLVFTFAVLALLGTTAHIKIQGARLPREALKRLRQLATKLS